MLEGTMTTGITKLRNPTYIPLSMKKKYHHILFNPGSHLEMRRRNYSHRSYKFSAVIATYALKNKKSMETL